MANDTYSPLQIASFQSDMQAWLSVLEASNQTPTLDSVGHPTVSIGVDLTVPNNFQAYLAVLGTESPGFDTALETLVTTKYAGTATQAAALYRTALKKFEASYTLPVLSAAQIQTLYSTIETTIYNSFTAYLTSHNIDMADLVNSDEGLAIFSLYYNGGGSGPKSLLGPASQLVADLNQSPGLFNRADAWLQIRYNSNGGNSASGGIAKRRYEESDVFGLYSPSDSSSGHSLVVPASEALAVYAEFSKSFIKAPTGGYAGESYRGFAFNYEVVYQNNITNANTDLGSPSLLNTDLALYQVGTLEEELQPAADALLQQYVLNVQANPFLAVGTFSTISISALDVQVAAVAGGNHLVASDRNGYVLETGIAGDYQDSLLIAQGGNDTLDASASTVNDALIGGTGSDVILGGKSGNDYIVAGTGDDSITLIGGDDTVVLGGAQYPADGGHDTVDASKDAGSVSYYVGAGTDETIKLGSGPSTLYLVPSLSSAALKVLSVSADFLSPGEWYDGTDGLFFIQQVDPATGQLDPGAATKNIKIIQATVPGTSGSSNSAHGLSGKSFSSAELQQMLVADLAAPASTTTELTLDNFTGSSDDGITLGAAPAAPTIPGSSNLSLLKDEGLVGDTTPGGDAQEVYQDNVAGALVGAIYGSDSSGNAFGNEIQADGNASYISTGKGNNTALLGAFFQHATDPTATALNATVQGGSGNQDLIGVGNGTETITGGAVGANTAAVTAIDGGGATADLVGGGQNSVIFGGTGADTLVGSLSSAGFDPFSIEMAGLSFWGDAYDSVVGADHNVGALPNVNWSVASPDNAQINLSLYQTNGTYATPFNLLGSTLDSGTAGSTTLPGSELIGGTGQDWLIGNSGNDTIIGGEPAHPVSGTTDEVLVGGAGANLIYGGGGSEIVYADMSPGAVAGWADLDPGDADTIYGGSGSDFIYGSGGNDVIYGGAGTDVIHAGNGATYIDAGSGNASVYGGSGNDTIVAEGTMDYIETGDGNSSIDVGGGQSTISTGAGSDTINADGGGHVLITEGHGAATVVMGTSTGLDTIQPGSGGTTVQLVDGLTESLLVVRDVNGDLVLSDGGSAEVTLQGYFANGSGVSLQFADGTTWGASQILQASITPSDDGSNDTLVGSNGSDNITAGFGDTSIVGVSGNNTLTGGAGSDTIQGGSGTDMIEGGSGSTQIIGGTGSETYVFNLGDGPDTIFENATAAGNDTLKFGAGITAADLTYTYDTSSNDLSIQFGALTASTITVGGLAATQANAHQIAAFAFADGTALSQLQVIQQALAIYGTTGSDSLIGTAGPNYFDGKGGNDTEVGAGGNDTFAFNAGYGQLALNESYASGQQPALQLGTGITALALHVASDGTNLLLTDGVGGDLVTIDNMWSTGGDGVAAVQLADGTTFTSSQLIQMEMTGTSGNDTFYGTSGADLLDGKGGNDSIVGDGGNDTFVFNSGYGHLAINEAYTGGQTPVLQLGAGITASALHLTSDGTSVLLTDGVSGDQITLDNMWSTSGDGVGAVQLADGTTLSSSQLIQMELTGGTSGNDTLYGTPGADLIDGKGGNDVEIGEGGNDTFVFNAGYGHLEINETFTSGQQPVLQLGAGITASALRVTANGSNLLLTDGITGDQITLDNAGSSNGNGVAVVQLADGTIFTATQLVQISQEISGTAGNDTLYGTSGADLIDGKGGNDSVIGGGGNDTFVFNAGYGHLEINESYATGQQPVLRLGAGITASALRVTTNGYNLFLTDGVAGDKVTLDNSWTNAASGVASVQLVDGTTLTMAQLQQMEMTGTIGNDTLFANSAPSLLDGKGGNDFEQGYGHNDTFVFNSGYGHLEINASHLDGQQSRLQLGAGITTSTLKLTADGSNLILTDGVSGDQVTLDYELTNTPGVQLVTFADGTMLTVDQLTQMVRQITGTAGSDTLNGTTGADLIDGKGGGDYVIGNGGADTFVFDAGYGVLSINEVANDYSVLQFGPGITASALHVATTGGDQGYRGSESALVLTDGVNGDQINLDYAFSANGFGVQEVAFADGTILTRSQLIQMAMIGTAGNDTLNGTSPGGASITGADLIDGKGGNDVAFGNGGNDTFVFNAGYGQLDINEYGGGPQSMLQLGAGIAASALRVTTDGYSLYLADGISGDKVTLESMWPGFQFAGDYGIATVQLADGTTLTRSQLIQMEMIGTAGSDTIYGTSGAELLDGHGGNDSVVGGGGNDTFVFNAGYGHLEIKESYASGQQSVLQLGVGIAATALHVTSDGTSLLLTDAISGDQITLINTVGYSGFGVQVVAFADGTTLTAAQLLKMEMTGTTGNDTLYGTSGDDLIDGKGGNDSVVGNGGNDTFVFNAGYGHLEINESYTTGSQLPVLQLGAGIAASALHVTESGNNLVLTDGISGDQITLLNMATSNTSGVASVALADGTTLSAAQLIQMLHDITGTTANDTLTGTTGADLIDGKGGNDSVVGNGGNDTFVFNSGYGHLAINESFTSAQQPMLQLGAGITASALHVTEASNNLLLTDGVSGDQITLNTMWSSATHGVATVKLADGTVLTRNQLIQMEMTGTTGNDTLYGTSGANLIDGNGGNDSVVGNGGSDTFVFNSGYGHLAINETYTSGQVPVLQLGAGITASVLHVTKTSNNLLLTDGVSGDQITLNTMWSSATHGVATVKLADGTTLTRAQLIQMEMTGTTGNDTITGTSGADLIDGKGGSDSVTGAGGSDTFVFNSGYGHLTINETYTSGQAPVLQLGTGIAAAALKVTKSGNNLVLTDGVTGDQITLTNMSSSSTSGVATVKFANGTSLTRSQLIAMEPAAVKKALSASLATSGNATLLQINPLIHAIASYTGNAAGGGGMTTAMIPPVTSEVMLHAAA